MVRFHWHVEDGYGAFIPPNGMSPIKDWGIQHAMVEIELAGQTNNVEACLTIPANYLKEDAVQSVGVVLAHGTDPAEWKGKLLTDIAVTLARHGYLVVRYICGQKELRRQRIFEKVLDTVATSPFACNISRWVLAGIGTGARIAAAVATRCRGVMAGHVLLSYPLLESMPTAKGPNLDNSEGPLLKLTAPVLLIQASHDEACSTAALMQLLGQMSSSDVRIQQVKEVDAAFKTLQGKGPMAPALRLINNAILDFVNALTADKLATCKLLRLKHAHLVQPEQRAAAQPAGAGAAAAGAVPAAVHNGVLPSAPSITSMPRISSMLPSSQRSAEEASPDQGPGMQSKISKPAKQRSSSSPALEGMPKQQQQQQQPQPYPHGGLLLRPQQLVSSGLLAPAGSLQQQLHLMPASLQQQHQQHQHQQAMARSSSLHQLQQPPSALLAHAMASMSQANMRPQHPHPHAAAAPARLHHGQVSTTHGPPPIALGPAQQMSSTSGLRPGQGFLLNVGGLGPMGAGRPLPADFQGLPLSSAGLVHAAPGQIFNLNPAQVQMLPGGFSGLNLSMQQQLLAAANAAAQAANKRSRPDGAADVAAAGQPPSKASRIVAMPTPPHMGHQHQHQQLPKQHKQAAAPSSASMSLQHQLNQLASALAPKLPAGMLPGSINLKEAGAGQLQHQQQLLQEQQRLQLSLQQQMNKLQQQILQQQQQQQQSQGAGFPNPQNLNPS